MRNYRRRTYGTRSRRSTYRGVRRTYRRKSFKKRVGSAMYKLAEMKQGSRTINFTGTPSIYYETIVPSIPQGPGDNQRIGNQVMSRFFTINLTITFVPGTAYAGETLNYRIYVVWPRQASYADAVGLISANNFPVQNMPDQDNWIYWRDTKYTLGNGLKYGTPYIRHFKFYKRFPCKIEFSRGAVQDPIKVPFIIIVNDSSTTVNATGYSVSGYYKMSYKDI